jgi:hypothetical protein
MSLFALHPTEEIRLRVAAVTLRERAEAMRRALRRQRANAVRVLPAQPLLWAELAPPEPTPTPAKRGTTERKPRPRAPVAALVASVFDLALGGAPRIQIRPRASSGQPEAAPLVRIIRDGDRTRCERLQPQETEEWQLREAARRARQVLPKPPKKARTISKKLAELVGGSDDE